MAGYSKTPLAKKLGIRAHARVSLVNAPADLRTGLEPLPDGVRFVFDDSPVDVALVFVTASNDVLPRFAEAASQLVTGGGVWFAWPKRTSGVITDVTENRLRELVLPTGFVDNKVCAIDDRWSGLRFVQRRELRAKASRP